MKTALIVEDDKLISIALTKRLASMGYEVDSARDAIYATHAAVRCKPEFVLLDISLPGGSGFVVADQIRAIADFSRTPIIFITASSNPEIKVKASEYRSACFLEKPFRAGQLINAIEQLCP